MGVRDVSLMEELKERRDVAMREVARCQAMICEWRDKWAVAEQQFDELDNMIVAAVRYERDKASRAIAQPTESDQPEQDAGGYAPVTETDVEGVIPDALHGSDGSPTHAAKKECAILDPALQAAEHGPFATSEDFAKALGMSAEGAAAFGRGLNAVVSRQSFVVMSSETHTDSVRNDSQQDEGAGERADPQTSILSDPDLQAKADEMRATLSGTLNDPELDRELEAARKREGAESRSFWPFGGKLVGA